MKSQSPPPFGGVLKSASRQSTRAGQLALNGNSRPDHLSISVVELVNDL